MEWLIESLSLRSLKFLGKPVSSPLTIFERYVFISVGSERFVEDVVVCVEHFNFMFIFVLLDHDVQYKDDFF